MRTRLFIILQYLLPQHSLSRFIGKLAEMKLPPWLLRHVLSAFVRRFNVDMRMARDPDLNNYPTFNHFFIRQLNPNMRPIATDNVLVSPVDGTVSQWGDIVQDQLVQAKGKNYTLSQLLANDPSSTAFNNGLFATFYLSPRDYHRVHMPYKGRLIRSIYVPGKLFSVNPITVEAVDTLFARNERLIALFETELGLMAVVFVGAMLVAGIVTTWQGVVTPNQSQEIQVWEHDNIIFDKGAELGYFNFGSTVILLLPSQKWKWLPELVAEGGVTMGMKIAATKIEEKKHG